MNWTPPPVPDGYLAMWTIYDHPSDHPDLFVARCWLVDGGGGEPQATLTALGCADIDAIRQAFRRQGMSCMPRLAADDPVIIETWM